MEFHWDSLDKADWEAFADRCEAGLQQRWTYGDSLAATGVGVARVAVMDSGRLLCVAQSIQRGPFGLISRGPLWSHGINSTVRTEAWRVLRSGLRRSGIRLLAITPEDEPAPGFHVMTGATLAQLPIAPPNRARLHGKWRNRLCAAEKSSLKITRGSTRPEALLWLLKADRAQQKTNGYRALPQAFTENWLSVAKSESLLLEVRHNNEPSAAMLFLLHGNTATYHIGWSGPAGRACHAHNLLLWRGIELLAGRGVKTLDLGTLDTVNAPGLARFKLGTGATPHRLGGTWLSL